MFGIRMLGLATGYCVVRLEIYSGANPQAPDAPRPPITVVAIQWVVILGAAFAMSFFSNYFGREILPGLIGV